MAHITLKRSGVNIPIFGLGTWLANGNESEVACTVALRHGHRHIDTAAMYENEEEVGRAVKNCGINREEIFITTKLLPDQHGAENAKRALNTSLSKLGLDYVDLYLIHVPTGGKVIETWNTLLELKKQGLIKAVGVSNFGVEQLIGLKATGCEMPDINQIELHVWNQQKETVDFCKAEGIAVEGYCPLARCKRFGETSVADIAAKLGKSEVDIALRWSVQKGFVTIPKSSNEDRIKSNFSVLDWSLTDEEMKELETVDENFEASSSVKAMKVPWSQVA